MMKQRNKHTDITTEKLKYTHGQTDMYKNNISKHCGVSFNKEATN